MQGSQVDKSADLQGRSFEWRERAKDYALLEALDPTDLSNAEWTTGDIERAFLAGAHAAERIARIQCANEVETYADRKHGAARAALLHIADVVRRIA